MTASAIRAWAIKGPEGIVIDTVDETEEWAWNHLSTIHCMDKYPEGYTCVPVEIREHPAQDATCPVCKGSGQRSVSSFVDPSKQVLKSCSACKGAGKIGSSPDPAQDAALLVEFAAALFGCFAIPISWDWDESDGKGVGDHECTHCHKRSYIGEWTVAEHEPDCVITKTIPYLSDAEKGPALIAHLANTEPK